jgi:FixJ family two-component response regulator
MAGPKRVALVEDDASMSHALARVLRLAGYRAATFVSGEAFIRDGGGAEADCLVLDVQLPGMSGFELRERLVQAGILAPVIFITAYDDVEARALAERADAVYLAKPFKGTALIDAIALALASTVLKNGN